MHQQLKPKMISSLKLVSLVFTFPPGLPHSRSPTLYPCSLSFFFLFDVALLFVSSSVSHSSSHSHALSVLGSFIPTLPCSLLSHSLSSSLPRVLPFSPSLFFLFLVSHSVILPFLTSRCSISPSLFSFPSPSFPSPSCLSFSVSLLLPPSCSLSLILTLSLIHFHLHALFFGSLLCSLTLGFNLTSSHALSLSQAQPETLLSSFPLPRVHSLSLSSLLYSRSQTILSLSLSLTSLLPWVLPFSFQMPSFMLSAWLTHSLLFSLSLSLFTPLFFFLFRALSLSLSHAHSLSFFPISLSFLPLIIRATANQSSLSSFL